MKKLPTHSPMVVCWFVIACATAGGDDDGNAGNPDARVIDLDGGGMPDSPAAMCTLVPQGGCPPGQACDLDPMGTGADTACRDVNMMGNEDDTCSSNEACAAGYSCINWTGNACMRYCTSSADCQAPGGKCLLTLNDGMGGSIPGVTLCTQNCVPDTSQGCPAGFGCHIFQDNMTMEFLTGCNLGGGGMQGASCMDTTDCAPNFSCFNVTRNGTTTSECLKQCNVTAGTGCAGIAGTVCQGAQTPVVVGGTEYGACL